MTTERKTNVTAYLPLSQVEWLDEQSGSRNETIRQAVEQLKDERGDESDG